MKTEVNTIPKSKEIRMRPVRVETLSPREFLKLQRGDIKKANIIPPRIGSKSLGNIKVEYKHLRFKPD